MKGDRRSDRSAGYAGFTRLDAVVIVLGVVFFGVVVLMPALKKVRMWDNFARCGDHLSAVGKAMLAYAGDYDDALPVAGGRGTPWSVGLSNWSGKDRSTAFGLDPNGAGGEATIGSSLYLLVRGRYMTAEKLVCPADKGARRFRPARYGLRDETLVDLWDFGPEPTRHVSYAYHVPYGAYPLTTAREPGFAVAADRNPWMDSPVAKAQDFSKFRPDIASLGGTNDQAHYGNSLSHRRVGQNVVFLDSHVQMERRAFCSREDDNIYTTSGRLAGDPWGTAPRLGSQPANRNDSLLVNDPPAPRR
jgi:hypothetical protein